MTSLQKQLASIAATSTHQLDLKAQRAAHGKSLLFEPKIAVSQDFNTIYQICLEGYQELCVLDSRFVPFARNIFSEQSKTQDRTQMTAKENEELDAVLESFLGLAGSRLLLKPAVKAVEWLVRRFRIHEYNTEFLILTFLPYHATPLFPTLLSILPRELPRRIAPTYRFLYPYMASLASPPRQTIVYTATNTQSFFTALNQYVLKVARARQHSSALLSFWASVITQAINGMMDAARSGRENIERQRVDDLLSRVLHIINEALKLKDIPDLTLGCCMIMIVLATKTDLEDKVLDGMMEAIAVNYTTETLSGCLVCLAVLAQERRAARLPRLVVKRLLRLSGLPQHLSPLAQQCRVDRLALGCALGVLERPGEYAVSVGFDLIARILDARLLDEPQTSILIKAVIDAVGRIHEDPNASADARRQLADLIIRLDESPTVSHVVRAVIKEHNVNVDLLEMRLKAVLRPLEPSVPAAEDGDVDMGDATVPVEQSFERTLSLIPSQAGNEVSLLESTKSSLFDSLSAAFLQAIPSKDLLDKFVKLPVLNEHHGQTSPLSVSFYARIWSGPQPALARCAAVEAVTEWAVSLNLGSVDLQALIPYLLIALGDHSGNVRRAAAKCVVRVNRLYRTDVKDAKKVQKERIWGSDTLYGESTQNVEWLSPEAAAKFLSAVLLPSLDECVLDESQIDKVIETALNGASRHGHTHERAELKSSLRAALTSFLSSHVASTPLLSVRCRLLSMLNRVGKSGSCARTTFLLPAVRQWISFPESQATEQCRLEGVDIKQMDERYLGVINPRDTEGLQLLQSIIDGSVETGRQDIQIAAFQRLRTIWPSLKSSAQQSLAKVLLDTSMSRSTDPAAQSRQENALETLRSLDLSSDVLASFVEGLPNAAQMPDKPPAAKRRRTSRAEMARFDMQDTEETTKALQRYTLVLELVESSTPENHPQLLKGLFHILAELQHYKTQTDSGLVYLQGLVIGCLLAIVDRLKAKHDLEADRSVIRADLLVDCVRNISNFQVQNTALLLISSLATWVPELVLHSVMPIFTFMGNTLLRQGDDYSAHVIDQTVSRVVPPLAASLRKRNQDLITGVAELLLSFTAAYEHIPLHRRLGLFVQLAKTLGVDDCLFAIVAMLVDRYPTDNRVRRFAADLMGSFDPKSHLLAASRYMKLVIDAAKPKRTISDSVLNFSEKSGDQKATALTNLLEALAELLDDRHLHNRLAKSFRTDDEVAMQLRFIYSELLQSTIELSSSVRGRQSLHASCEKVLAALLRLLPTVDFVKSAESLLDHPDAEIPRTVLRSFEMQIERVKQNDEAARGALLNFTTRVTAVLQQSRDAVLKHSAVACIDRISDKFGKLNPAVISTAAETIVSERVLGDPDDRLRVMSILCLASMVEILRDDFIPLLPQVLPKIFEYLRESIESQKERLHNAVYSLLSAIIEHIPFMFSGNYLDTTLQLSHSSASAELNDDADESRIQFYQLAARQIDAKECFAAIERNFDHAVREGYLALSEHLNILSTAIDRHPKSAIIKNSQFLFNIFLKALDLRRVREADGLADKYDDAELDQMEGSVNEAAIAMTMKLNDAAFRPFFLRLVDWASKALPKRNLRGKTLRSTSLFVFLEAFFERLKSIVTNYSSYILEFAADILRDTSPAAPDAQALLKAVLHALRKSFEHDQDDFWQSPSHFSIISTPLLTQLTHSDVLSLTDNVIPTITELATAAASGDHHKEMNSQILKYMRSDDAQVRLAAVKCQQSLTDRLGEDWLGLLPEMLPFISELQEDDDEAVERETGRWIRSIEEILGESLDAMLQ